jgi:hypothetical protein|tara:strand:+ start:2561 stop:2827 length:267 start_codon:yes stop_codon:yes gene_type:complete
MNTQLDSVWIRHEYPLRGTHGQSVDNLPGVQVTPPLTTLINPLPTRRRATLCQAKLPAALQQDSCINEKNGDKTDDSDDVVDIQERMI